MKKIFKSHWPVGIIVAAWIIFSAPYFTKGLIPFPSRYLVTFFPPWNASYGMPVKNNAMPDVITQIFPWKKLTIENWKSGEVPLWNPYSFAGTAHLANYQSAALSPFNLLFFIFPRLDAWSILVLLQPLLAGLFMCLYLKSLKRSETAVLVGSLAFMFCGFMVVWMAYATLGYAALWLPFIFWAIPEKKKKKTRWSGPIIALGIVLSFLSGHFQISIYVTLLSFLYAFFVARRAAIFILLGIFLAGPQLFPALAVYGQSVRSGLFSRGGEIIPWQYLMTMIAPDFYGNPVTRNDWFGHYAEWAGFIGVIPLLSALYALMQRKTKQELFFSFAAGIALLSALPTPLTWLLFRLKIPALSTSAASRVIVLASFSLAVLAAFGVDKLAQDWKEKEFRRVRLFTIVLVIFMFGTWFLLLGLNTFPPEYLLVAKRNFLLPTALLLGFAVITAAGVFLAKKWHRVLLFALLFLTLFDTLRYASKWMPFEERQFVYPDMPVISFLSERLGNNRVFGNFGNELATYFRIPSLEGYDAVYQRRYAEFISAFHDGKVGELARSVVLVDKHGKYTEDMFQLLGVRYILHRVGDGRNIWAYPFWNYPQYSQIYKDELYEILENTKAYPRAFLASHIEIIDDGQEILSRLLGGEIDRSSTVILEKPPAVVPLEGAADIVLDRYAPTNIRLSVRSEVPKILFLSDVYDSGWRVTIDGSPAEVLRANYAFRAVAVPAGEHIVIFSYLPAGFVAGALAAVFSASFILFISLRPLRYENRFL